MFERFTDRARRVVVLSEEEARDLGHSFIRPEHLFLGLVQGDGVAARVLAQYRVNLDGARENFAGAISSSAEAKKAAKVPFSPKAKKTLELSLREALRLGHNYIGTEHILLALVRQAGTEDFAWLTEISATDLNALRSSVEELLKGSGSGSDYARTPAVIEVTARARGLAGKGLLTTGHLLWSMLEDARSMAGMALSNLGVTKDAVEAELERIPVDETTDAAPRPVVVEIRVGESKVTVDDPAVTAAITELTPEELKDALQQALKTRQRRKRPRAAN